MYKPGIMDKGWFTAILAVIAGLLAVVVIIYGGKQIGYFKTVNLLPFLK
jgi:hypothetical protein